MLVVNADKNVKMNPPIPAEEIIFCRPQVSARNPQTYDANTLPRNEKEFKAPCSLIVKFMSHFTYGNTKLIAKLSDITAAKLKPVKITNKT